MKNRILLVLVILGQVAFSDIVNRPGGMKDPTTTKGDLICRTSSATTRLAVGTNGQFLQADSTQTCGVKYVTASGTGNLTSINSDATAAQTLAVGTSGTDFAIADNASGTHTFNLPDAGASARGLITTGTQTLAGAKNFSGTTTVGGTGTSGFNNQAFSSKSADVSTSGSNAAIVGYVNETTNTAGSGSKVGVNGQYNRTISSNTTDTATPSALSTTIALTAGAATFTDTQSQGWSSIYVSGFNLASGTAAISHYAQINVAADSVATGTNKYALRTGNQTGATNNYQLNLGTGISKFADTTASTSSTTGSAVFAGGLGIAGNSVIAGSLKFGNYHMEPTENDAGNSSTAVTIDWSTGASQKVTMTGAATFTFSNPQTGGSYVLRVLQDGTGSRVATWPAAVKWPAGTAPTLTTTASHMDLLNFYFDGVDYYGSSSLNYTP